MHASHKTNMLDIILSSILPFFFTRFKNGKSKSIFWAIILICCILLGIYFQHPSYVLLEINNGEILRVSIAQTEDGTIYFPFKQITALMSNSEYPFIQKGKTFEYKDNKVTANTNQIIKTNEEIYVSKDILTALNLNIFCGDDNVWRINNFPRLDYSWSDENYLIAHALGGIDNMTYTNSLEAFETNYNLGHRVFEVDFITTSEGITVAAHDWTLFYSQTGKELNANNSATALSVDEFKRSKVYGQYTTVTLTDIIQLMKQYPDIYIVTDTKDTQSPEVDMTFKTIIQEAKAVDETILDRIIPQIYNTQMYDTIKELHPWKSVIFTLYNLGADIPYDDVYNYSYENGITVITTKSGRCDEAFLKKLHNVGIRVYMHTYNDLETVQTLYAEKDIHGVYTDFLTPDEMANIH